MDIIEKLLREIAKYFLEDALDTIEQGGKVATIIIELLSYIYKNPQEAEKWSWIIVITIGITVITMIVITVGYAINYNK